MRNPSGGFLGCWWGWSDWNENEIYLQIEQGNFVFKMGSDLEDKGSAQWRHGELLKAAAEKGLPEIKQPKCMRSGTAMTCAMVERKDWLGADDSIIDFEAVVKRLQKYQELLDSTSN